MRPDRIVVGEVRGAEALDLMQAMNTGHRGSMGSLHANSPRDALLRLQGLMRESEQSLSEEVSRDLIAQNLNMILHCDRRGGKRCVASIGMIRGLDGNRVLMETLE
jgi:pilus assembly protein CpaF